MTQIKCPSCGAAVEVPGTKKGTKVAIGCLIAAGLALPVIAVVGLLAAIAIPSFVKARSTAQTRACINNMRMIDAGKEQSALENQYDNGTTVPNGEISKFLQTPVEQMTCVAGGTYTPNPLGSDPECSIHGQMSNASPPSSRPQQR
jgi:Tfp pilus assembly protein PilE